MAKQENVFLCKQTSPIVSTWGVVGLVLNTSTILKASKQHHFATLSNNNTKTYVTLAQTSLLNSKTHEHTLKTHSYIYTLHNIPHQSSLFPLLPIFSSCPVFCPGTCSRSTNSLRTRRRLPWSGWTSRRGSCSVCPPHKPWNVNLNIEKQAGLRLQCC